MNRIPAAISSAVGAVLFLATMCAAMLMQRYGVAFFSAFFGIFLLTWTSVECDRMKK